MSWRRDHWSMDSWADGRSGRHRASSDGRVREALADPWADYIGSQRLTPYGSPTAEALGFSGWSAANYAEGPLAPGPAQQPVTIGIRYLTPPSSGVHALIGHDGTNGIRLYYSGGLLYCLVTNSAGQNIINRSDGPTLPVGTDTWCFVHIGPGDGAAQSGFVVHAVGNATLHVENRGAHLRTVDLTTQDHRIGQHAGGDAFGSTIKQVLTWGSLLSNAAMGQVATGTPGAAILGYFEP